MNGVVTVSKVPDKVWGYWGRPPEGDVHINMDDQGNLWASGFGCGDGLLPIVSAEAAKGSDLVLITPSGRRVIPGKVVGIRCTSKTVGEYEASGFWAGES